jgi:hypothetical protein
LNPVLRTTRPKLFAVNELKQPTRALLPEFFCDVEQAVGGCDV